MYAALALALLGLISAAVLIPYWCALAAGAVMRWVLGK